MNKIPAIVTNCDLRFGFNVARSLTRHKVPIIAVTSGFSSMCSKMDGIISSYQICDPFKDPIKYIETINEISKKYQKIVLIPSHEDIFVASKYKDKFTKNINVLADEWATLKSFHDKLNLMNLSSNFGIKYPKTKEFFLEKDYSKFNDSVLKPRYGEGGRGVIYIKGSNLNIEKFKRIISVPYIIQNKIKGKGAAISVLAYNGRVIARSGHLRVREIPKTGGTSCARRTFINSDTERKISELIKFTKFSGVIMFEFKLNSDNDELTLLDANPRYWGGLATHIESGVDFPYLHYLHLGLNKKITSDIVQPNKLIESRWFLGEVRYFIESIFHIDISSLKDILDHSKYEIIYEDLEEGGWRNILSQIITYLKRFKSRRSREKQEINRVRLFED